MIDLAEFLEANCSYLTEQIAKVPAQKDLEPLLVGFRDEDGLSIVLPPARQLSKSLTMTIFKTLLRQAEADRYVVIWPAWYVAVTREEHRRAYQVLDREGIEEHRGEYKDRRKECYQVTVGDRERTLAAFFDVERDYKGKMRRLVRREGNIEQHFGRAVNLLVDETMH
jgi:hypothetical protein